MTLKQAKMNARERRNNHRLLKGNAQSGVYYPGQMLEIDAVAVSYTHLWRYMLQEILTGISGRLETSALLWVQSGTML